MGDSLLKCDYSEFDRSSLASSLLVNILRNDSQGRMSLEMSESYLERTDLSIFDGNPIPRLVCEAVLLKLHVDLRKLLNFTELWPFLNKRGLLATNSQAFFVNPENNAQIKVDYLMTKLLEYPHEDFLTPLVKCLAESHLEEGMAQGHKDLIKEIIRLYKVEIKKYKAAILPRKFSHWLFVVIVSFLAALAVAYVALLGIYFHKLVPHSPRSIQVLAHTSFVVSLDDLIPNRWIYSVGIRWNSTKSFNCRGNVSILHGVSCSNSLLSERRRWKYDVNGLTLPRYLLPGSIIYVTVNNSEKANDVVVKLSQSIREYNEIIYAAPAKPSCDSRHDCYNVNNLPSSPATFNITKREFYYVFFLNSNDGEFSPPEDYTVDYYIDALLYSNDSVVKYSKNHSHEWAVINDDYSTQPVKVKVSEWFQFSQPSCNLLQYSCEPGPDLSLIVQDAEPRADIIILTTLVFGMSAAPLVILLLILSIQRYRFKRRLVTEVSNKYQ